MNLFSKISTFFWFLLRPLYFKQMTVLIKMRLMKNKKEDTRRAAEIWCKERMETTKGALFRITGKDCPPLESLFGEILEQSKIEEGKCPIKMGGSGDVSLLYHLCEFLGARNVVETGVAYGWSSLSILLSLQNRDASKLISTDMPYVKQNNEKYVGCVVPKNLRANWDLLRVPDRKGLPLAFAQFGKIDLCHYDSDKSYVGRMWSYPRLWSKLKTNGIFVSDDVGDNIAFQEFAKELRIEPIIVKVRNQFVGVLIKTN